MWSQSYDEKVKAYEIEMQPIPTGPPEHNLPKPGPGPKPGPPEQKVAGYNNNDPPPPPGRPPDYLDQLMADEGMSSLENDLLYEASWHELNCGKLNF
jgi:hypothetical protein